MKMKGSPFRYRQMAFLITIGLGILFLSKPVHIDEANFLALAGGEFWSPHNIRINWQGKTERAFDVLSNPPGLAWWLYPVRDLPLPSIRLWMLPWSILAAAGAWELGRRFTNFPSMVCLMTILSPLFMLSNGALMPDMPLMACAFLGLAGLSSQSRVAWPWALLAGFSFWFRYSGIALLPVIFLWFLKKDGIHRAIFLSSVASVPILLLLLHDLHAYGSWHFLEMIGFQSVERDPMDLLRKFAASLSMLAGGAVLPFFFCTKKSLPAIIAGLIFGVFVTASSEITGFAAAWTVFWIAGGAAIIYAAASAGGEDRWLGRWLLVGLVFIVLLRFVATRYWAPFFLPAVILGLKREAFGPIFARAMLFFTALLSLFLALDDYEFARAQKNLSQIVLSHSKEGVFAGHWGFQHHMEEANWRPVEEDTALTDRTYFARSLNAWPQEIPGQCLKLEGRWHAEDAWPGPRVHTLKGHGNFHSYALARGPSWSFVSWSWGSDPHDTVELFFNSCP